MLLASGGTNCIFCICKYKQKMYFFFFVLAAIGSTVSVFRISNHRQGGADFLALTKAKSKTGQRRKRPERGQEEVSR